MLKKVGEKQTFIWRGRYMIFSGERDFPPPPSPRALSFERREKKVEWGAEGKDTGDKDEVEIGIVRSTKNVVHGLRVIEFVAYRHKVSA
jgi:hypothetical protein